ncbi:MAG: nucleotidyltransferase domain-containing protein [Candidatus Diapherotrites archaeon]|nr:nucleotidyltransferase domain-containing protein [Candidatus Diapherotrites archaeon]
MNLLGRLLDSASKAVLLEKLVDSAHSFSVSELNRFSDVPKATVSRTVSDWENAGLVLVEHRGRNKMVRINPKFYLLKDLKAIVRKTRDPQKPLLHALKSMKVLHSPSIKAVVVFGSRVRTDFSHASDLDILIGLEDPNDAILDPLSEAFIRASARTGIRFSPVILSKKEIRMRIKEKDKFIRNILAEGKILKGASWLERTTQSDPNVSMRR